MSVPHPLHKQHSACSWLANVFSSANQAAYIKKIMFDKNLREKTQKSVKRKKKHTQKCDQRLQVKRI